MRQRDPLRPVSCVVRPGPAGAFTSRPPAPAGQTLLRTSRPCGPSSHSAASPSKTSRPRLPWRSSTPVSDSNSRTGTPRSSRHPGRGRHGRRPGLRRRSGHQPVPLTCPPTRAVSRGVELIPLACGYELPQFRRQVVIQCHVRNRTATLGAEGIGLRRANRGPVRPTCFSTMARNAFQLARRRLICPSTGPVGSEGQGPDGRPR